MKRTLGIAAGLLLFASNVAVAEGDPAAGEAKSAVCAACHGTDGNSVVNMWPKIAGQHEAYLVRHIELIRSNDRPVPEMYAIAQGLSDQDIKDLSAYYAAQTMSPGAADESLVDLGEAIYRAGNAESGVPACAACHGPTGSGNPLVGYPWVAGQHATYTTSMLNKYRDGTVWGEGDANSAVMVGVAKELTDEEIAAVSSYIEGLYREK
ncbi:MAG: c-type cytochrome [Pseudomonadota bacterium]